MKDWKRNICQSVQQNMFQKVRKQCQSLKYFIYLFVTMNLLGNMNFLILPMWWIKWLHTICKFHQGKNVGKLGYVYIATALVARQGSFIY